MKKGIFLAMLLCVSIFGWSEATSVYYKLYTKSATELSAFARLNNQQNVFCISINSADVRYCVIEKNGTNTKHRLGAFISHEPNSRINSITKYKLKSLIKD